MPLGFGGRYGKQLGRTGIVSGLKGLAGGLKEGMQMAALRRKQDLEERALQSEEVKNMATAGAQYELDPISGKPLLKTMGPNPYTQRAAAAQYAADKRAEYMGKMAKTAERRASIEAGKADLQTLKAAMDDETDSRDPMHDVAALISGDPEAMTTLQAWRQQVSETAQRARERLKNKLGKPSQTPLAPQTTVNPNDPMGLGIPGIK